MATYTITADHEGNISWQHAEDTIQNMAPAESVAFIGLKNWETLRTLVNDLRDHGYDLWTIEDNENGWTVEAGAGEDDEYDEDGNLIDDEDLNSLDRAREKMANKTAIV
jgi:hypothetical protein